MGEFMRLELLDSGLKDFMVAQTGKAFDLGEAPVGAKDLKTYGIIYRVVGGEGVGSWSDPEESRVILYHFKLVGHYYREASWLSDRVNDIVVGRKPGGGYKQDLVIAGLSVEDRWVETLGSILPSGEDRFTVDDHYRMRVSNA